MTGGTGLRQRAQLSFTLALHRALAPDPTVSVCWSPFSVASALGLAASGARGRTRAELTGLLGPLAEHAALLTEAARLDGADAVLAVANTLWARPDVPIAEQFGTELLSWPGGAIADAPFDTDTEGARRLINADVATRTRQLIPELIARGVLTEDTLATLVNAVYLKTAWQHRFPEHATRPAPFHAPDGVREVPTMRLTATLGYAATAGWQVVTLPAAGGVQAVVLLPERPLAEAEPALDVRTLATLLDAPAQRRVELHLPSFRVRRTAPLTDALRALGVTTMFDRTADFSGISGMPLRVSEVLHQAVLAVDERGIEAAAATAVVLTRAMAMRSEPAPVLLRVDRPFLLLVRHRDSGAGYFLARITRPSTPAL